MTLLLLLAGGGEAGPPPADGYTVEAAFGDGPLDVPTYDVDLSDRIQRIQWNIGRTRGVDDWLPGGFTLEFDNSDRELDPEYTAGSHFGDLVPRVPIRVRVTHDGTTYNLLHGFAGEDGWEQTYQPPEVAECSVRCTDLLGVLAGRPLPSVLEYEILEDSPVAYWPLGETSGLVMVDRSGNGHDGEYTHGTTALTTTVGIGDDATPTAGFVFDGEHIGEVTTSALALTDADVPLTFEMVLRGDVANKVMLRSGNGNATEGVTIQLNASGEPTATVRHATDGTAFAAGTDGLDALGHHLGFRVPSGAASSLWWDGVDVTTSNSTITGGGVVDNGTVVGGTKYVSSVDNGFEGFLAHVAIFDSDIGATRMAAHAAAALAPWGGDTTGERIGNTADLLGIPAALQDCDTGLTTLGPAVTEGRDALDYITACNRTEQGILTVAHWDTGQLRFISRTALLTDTRHTTSQATFTDAVGALSAGEYRYERNLRIEPASINTVVNQVTVNYIGGTVSVEDSTSIAAYGPRGRSFDTLHANPAEARSFAEYVLSRYKDPITRVRELSLDCAAEPDGLGAALTLRPGDRVTVMRTPQNVGNTITEEYLIEGISGLIADGVNTFDVTYFLSPADTTVFGLWGDDWGTSLWAY